VACVGQFELVEDESFDEMVESARGVFGMFDDFLTFTSKLYNFILKNLKTSKS